jgi:hypothetical protein
MPHISITRAREAEAYRGDDSQLRPRPLSFRVSESESARCAEATPEQLDQYARNLIANYMNVSPTSIDYAEGIYLPERFVAEGVEYVP